MKEFGIEVKFFNTTPFYNFREVQYRNHRKALIIDQETAVVGGRNVADEYFDLSPTYNYLDRDMAIHGEIVGSISRTFEANFNSQWATHIKLPKKPSEDDPRYHRQDYDKDLFLRELRRWNRNQDGAHQFLSVAPDISQIRQLGQKALGTSLKGTCNKLQFLSEIPGFGRKKKYGRILKNLIRDKIESAQSNIIIESPYFVVTDEFREVLDKAFDSQVNIKLLTNSLNSTDHVFVFSAFESELYGMMNKYLDTYVVTGQRPDGYDVLDQVQNSFYGIHSKTFVFDDKDFIISTFNFDPRSSDINSELLILCEDSPELALKIRDNVRERTKESFHVESSDDLYDATYKKGKLKKIIFSLISKIPAKVFRFLL
jgi:putative cardiolipin synthase